MIMVFVLAYKLGSSDQATKRPLLNIASQSIAALISGTIIAVFLAHYFNEREERTWQCRLESGQRIGRSVKLTENSKANWHLLLIDCEAATKKGNRNNNSDDPLALSTININGKELTAPSFNPASLIQSWAKLDQMQTDFASVFGKAPSALRQWRAYYIPPDYLNNASDNDIWLTAGKAVTVFGDSAQVNGQAAFIPAIEYLSATKFLQEQESPDGRIVTPTFQTKQSSCFEPSKVLWEWHDLSPSLGRQCGSYRMYIVAGSDSFWQRNSLNTTSYAEAF